MTKITRRNNKRPPTETRNLMLEAISTLLETRAPWDIRASDVAAASGTAQPNFYSHFRNIEEAIMARGEQVWASYPGEDLATLLDEGLDAGEGAPLFREFFSEVIDFWTAHGGVLRAISRLPGDEHPTVLEVRHRAQSPVLEVCERAIIRSQAEGVLPAMLLPRLAANGALRFIDEAANHFGAITEIGKYDRDAAIATLADMFQRLLRGG